MSYLAVHQDAGSSSVSEFQWTEMLAVIRKQSHPQFFVLKDVKGSHWGRGWGECRMRQLSLVYGGLPGLAWGMVVSKHMMVCCTVSPMHHEGTRETKFGLCHSFSTFILLIVDILLLHPYQLRLSVVSTAAWSFRQILETIQKQP